MAFSHSIFKAALGKDRMVDPSLEQYLDSYFSFKHYCKLNILNPSEASLIFPNEKIREIADTYKYAFHLYHHPEAGFILRTRNDPGYKSLDNITFKKMENADPILTKRIDLIANARRNGMFFWSPDGKNFFALQKKVAEMYGEISTFQFFREDNFLTIFSSNNICSITFHGNNYAEVSIPKNNSTLKFNPRFQRCSTELAANLIGLSLTGNINIIFCEDIVKSINLYEFENNMLLTGSKGENTIIALYQDETWSITLADNQENIARQNYFLGRIDFKLYEAKYQIIMPSFQFNNFDAPMPKPSITTPDGVSHQLTELDWSNAPQELINLIGFKKTIHRPTPADVLERMAEEEKQETAVKPGSSR